MKFGLSAGLWALRWMGGKGFFGRWRVRRGNWRRRGRIVGSMLVLWGVVCIGSWGWRLVGCGGYYGVIIGKFKLLQSAVITPPKP